MECRTQCGACCIAPSINRPYFGMPNGKPAGVTCIHLDLQQLNCKIWGTANYPATCHGFQAELSVCGANRNEAIELITILEAQTAD